MSRLFHRFPARYAAPLTLAFFALLLAGFNSLHRIELARAATHAQYRERLLERLAIEQARLEVVINREDRLTARRLVGALAARPEITHAWLVDQQGRIEASFHRRDLGRALGELSAGIDFDLAELDRLFRREHPKSIHVHAGPIQKILIGHAAIGSGHQLVTRMDLGGPLASRIHEEQDNLARETLAILFSATLLWAILHAFWLRRARGLVDTVYALGAGNMAARSNLEGRDELALIGQAVDRMAQEQLQRNHAQRELQTIIDRSPVVAISWLNQPDWPVVFISDNVSQWGYRKEDWLSGALKFADILHPDDLARIETEVAERCTRGPDDYHQRYRLHHADGHWIWIDDHTWLTRNFLGQVIRIDGVLLDISERHRAEAALQATHERAEMLAGLLQSSAQPFGQGFPDGTLGFHNQAFLDLLGYTEEEFSQLDWALDLTPPEWLQSELASLDQLHRSGRPVVYQKEYLRKDGSRVPIELLVHLVRDDEGQPRYYYAFITDITQRKQAQAALEEREASFRLLAEQTPAILYRASLDELSQTLYISPRVAELGYSPEEWLARPEIWVESLHPDDRDRALDQLALFQREGGRLSLSYRLRTRAGDWRYMQDEGEILHDGAGRPLYLQGLMMDVTAREEAEAALRASEQRLRSLGDNLPQSYIYQYSQDADGRPRFHYLSSGVEAVHGVRAAAALDDPLLVLKQTLPEHLPLICHLEQESARHLRDFNAEAAILRPDGEKRWLQLRSRPSRREDGGIVWDGVATDITQHRRDEELLDLQKRRAEALLELPRAAESLTEKDFMQRGQELAEDLTGSCISFIHFVNDDETTIELVTWSRRTLERYCHAAFDRHYPVEQAGIWADALRRHEPVIFNDYPAYPAKRGLPEGHSELHRLISLPVLENGKVVMLTGVGNKAADYTDLDVETIQLISNEIWRLVQHQRAQRKLTRLGDALEHSGNEVYLFDPESLHFLEANAAARRNLGYELGELRGMTPLQVKTDLTREAFDAYLAPLRERKESLVRFVTRHRRMDGSFYPVEVSVELTPDEPPAFMAIISDISQRLALETQLQKLAQAVEQSPESIAITNLEARLEYVNEAFLRNTGYTREEVLGQNPRVLHSGKTPQSTYDALWNALSAGQSWKGEFINRRRDGSEYIEFAIITPLKDAAGRITHYVAVKEDITEKKAIAAELDSHREHLEELVSRRTTELIQARRDAERLARVKSEFLANMSHEIRTPLNAVLGFAQIGLRDSAGRGAHETFSRIADAGQLLLRVVNDILDYSRIEAGKLAIEQGVIHPGEIIERCAELVRAGVAAKGLALRTRVAADVPATCLGDDLRVSQVLMNLLTNAVKFTQRGGITLSAYRRGDELCFAVEDTGIGIAPEDQERLFQPFEQADGSTTRRFGGSGLGLAISKRLTQLMGGWIGAESLPGTGSVFRFGLPCREAPMANKASTAAADMPGGGRALEGLRVLVAEDNEVNRLVLEDMLPREGCDLVQVANGRLAVDAVREQGAERFDLVLMDIQMPEMDGYAATRAIHEFAPDLPIVGLTAHALEEERKRCLAAGMVEHVAKPIVLPELLAAIRRHARGATGGMNASDAATLQAAQPPRTWAEVEQRYRGNQAFLGRLLRSILAGNADKPEALRQAAAKRDFPTLAFHCHSLKGMAGDLLPAAIRDLSAHTESAARKNAEEAAPLAITLADALAQFLQDARDYLASRSMAAPSAEARLEAGQLDRLLQELESLLARNDTRANLLLQRHGAALRLEFGAAMEALEGRIEGFDYETALQLLHRLRARQDGG